MRSLVERGGEFDEGPVYHITRVDVDGDGLGDLLVKTEQGTASCNYWWAYKRTKGKALAGPLLFSIGEMSYCGTALSFVRHRGRNYVYEDRGEGIGEVMDPAKITTYADAPMKTLCKLTYEHGYDRAKVTPHCSDRACAEIAKVAGEIAASPSAMRAGEEVACDSVGCVGEGRKVDLGNDGAEVVVGIYYRGDWNPDLRFFARSSGGKYQEFDPATRWEGYGEIAAAGLRDPVLGHSIVSVGNKNYWVVTSRGANGARELSIFVVEGRKVRKAGSVMVDQVPVSVQVHRE